MEMNLASFNENELPGTVISFAPVLVPILMILTKTFAASLGYNSPLLTLICDPVTAVLSGVLIAIFGLMGNRPTADVVKLLESSLSNAGLIVFITGAGGALGQVLRDSGIGTHVAEVIQFSGFPAILLPLIMASLLKLSQGSGTVALITTASILAPMLESGSLNLSPMVCALAICVGPFCASYFNDSYFWVVTRFSGMDVKTGVKTWTLTTVYMGVVGSATVIVMSLFM
jgi:GntP family gluconate:H+ symporter